MDATLANILTQFPLDGEVTSCERYGCGHINETYLVVTATGHRYILQKINNHIFKDVPALMENIASVTEYLRKSQSDPRRVLTLVYTTEGNAFLHHTDDTYWRVYEFVEDSVCLQAPENAMDFYQSAVAFGTFQQQLKDFPAETLHETIPLFHNTPNRYKQLREVLERDPMGRAKDVPSIYSSYFAPALTVGIMYSSTNSSVRSSM